MLELKWDFKMAWINGDHKSNLLDLTATSTASASVSTHVSGHTSGSAKMMERLTIGSDELPVDDDSRR